MNTWTNTRPTQSGYYWWRKSVYSQESIYYVFISHEESIEKENANRPQPISRYSSINEVTQENRVFYARWCGSGLYDKCKLEEIKGQWQGPLTPND